MAFAVLQRCAKDQEIDMEMYHKEETSTASVSGDQGGRSSLTPGQVMALDFPVVGEAEPSAGVEAWQITITGAVENEIVLDLDQFVALRSETEVWDTICVTGWTHFDHRWTGVRLDTLLNMARPLPGVRFVKFEAYSTRNHSTSLEIAWARNEVLLAYRLEDEALSRVHGGPVRSVCRGKYFYKSVKWIKRIELLYEDEPGYWESESAYHNEADPILEQRFEPRPLNPQEFAERSRRLDFSQARATKDSQFTSKDLAGATFAGAAIKGSKFTRANMRGAYCAGANFTLSKFTLADLTDADLSNCDLEGADFASAILINADLRGANTSLTATKFLARNRDGSIAKTGQARIQGTRFSRKSLGKLSPSDREYIVDVRNGAIVEDDLEAS